MLRRPLFFCLLLALVGPGAEGITRCEKLFKELFELKGFVCPGECDTNVKKFVERLRDDHPVTFKKVRVLYLSPVLPDTKAWGSPGATRSGEKEPWSFHAVLEYNGRILDFDYTQNPQPVPVAEYFAAMFPGRDLKVIEMTPEVFLRLEPPGPVPEPPPDSFGPNFDGWIDAYRESQNWYRHRRQIPEPIYLREYTQRFRR